jgi:hypothetical protein
VIVIFVPVGGAKVEVMTIGLALVAPVMSNAEQME